MGKLLLHPTHRKFIRILREHIEQGKTIIITQNDIVAFRALMHRTKIALERHKGIYRLLLQAMQRTVVNNGDFVLNSSRINFIESIFCKVERKNIFVTIRNIIVLPILHKMISFLRNNP